MTEAIYSYCIWTIVWFLYRVLVCRSDGRPEVGEIVYLSSTTLLCVRNDVSIRTSIDLSTTGRGRVKIMSDLMIRVQFP